MSAIAGGSKPEIIGSVRLLLEHGAEANAKNGVGDTPLHIAVRAANLALVRLLMEHGANANFVGDKGLTPMGLARKAGNVEMVAALSKE